MWDSALRTDLQDSSSLWLKGQPYCVLPIACCTPSPSLPSQAMTCLPQTQRLLGHDSSRHASRSQAMLESPRRQTLNIDVLSACLSAPCCCFGLAQ